MKADEARDRALAYFKSSDLKRAGESSLEAIKLYSSDLVLSSRPAQINYIKMNIDKCVEVAKISLGNNITNSVSKEDSEEGFTPIKTNVKFSDVSGLDEIKVTLKEDLLEFENIRNFPGVKNPKGMILYGPPGCGKTMLGKALAGEFNLDFYYISCADILSKYYGESSRLVKELYNTSRKTKSIIFIDEFEELASRKDSDSHEATRKIINQLLVEIDGMENNNNVYTIGATNIPTSIEPAVLRRLRPVYVPLPDENTRGKIISKLTQGHRVDNEYIAHLTESRSINNLEYYFSCDDLVELVGLSSRMKWRETKNKNMKLSTDDILSAYVNFTPSVNENDMKRYTLMQKEAKPKTT